MTQSGNFWVHHRKPSYISASHSYTFVYSSGSTNHDTNHVSFNCN